MRNVPYFLQYPHTNEAQEVFFAMDSGRVWGNAQKKNGRGVGCNVQQKNSRTDLKAAWEITRGSSLK